MNPYKALAKFDTVSFYVVNFTTVDLFCIRIMDMDCRFLLSIFLVSLQNNEVLFSFIIRNIYNGIIFPSLNLLKYFSSIPDEQSQQIVRQ